MDEFFPWGDTLVIDDNSTDRRILEYLEQRARVDSRFSFRMAPDRVQKVREGGLYHNMDIARHYAIDHDYDLVFFMQDDMQFVWKDEEFISTAWRILSMCGDISCLNPLFCGRIKYVDQYEYVQSADAYRSKRGLFDVFVARVSLFSDIPDCSFANSERANSRFWLKQRRRAYQVATPIACFVPLTYAGDGTLKVAPVQPAPGEYYVRPLHPDAIKRLKTRDRTILPFSEDYVESIGKCRVPHWWNAKFERRYYALCGETFLKEVARFSFPVEVTQLKDWTDTSEMAPEPSHLNDGSQSARAISVVGKLVRIDLFRAIIGRALFFLFSLVIKRHAKRYMFSG